MSLPAAEATHTAAAIDVADRNSLNASLTLAFAQSGNTLLYLLLRVRSQLGRSGAVPVTTFPRDGRTGPVRFEPDLRTGARVATQALRTAES